MSQALADAHRLQQIRLAADFSTLTGELYRKLVDPSNVAGTFPAFVRATQLVVGKGRDASWALARDYYVAESKAHGVPASAHDIPVRRINAEQMTAAMNATGIAAFWKNIGKGGNTRTAKLAGMAATMGSAKRLILNGGREFLVDASMDDPVADGYARISDGAPCHFCAMLISRGPVYTRETASFDAHDHCGCNARLVYPDDPDNGWSLQATALRDLWNETGDVNSFRAALAHAYHIEPGILSPAQMRVRALVPPELIDLTGSGAAGRVLTTPVTPVPTAPNLPVPPTPSVTPWAKAVEEAKASMPLGNSFIGVKTNEAGELVDDLTPMGKLGPDTEKALDGILAAGKALDTEIRTRIAKRLPVDEVADFDVRHAAAMKELADLQTTFVRTPEIEARIKAFETERQALNAMQHRIPALRREKAAMWREELKSVLGDIREVGGGARANFKGRDDLVSALLEAHDVYPTAWNDRVSAKFPEVRVIQTGRGYNRGGYEIALSKDGSERPYGHVAVHELGHSMEEAVPGLRGAEWAFLYRRSDKRVTKAGKESLKGRVGINGSSKEKAYADKWAHAYTGRTYQPVGQAKYFSSATGGLNSWEVFTTGIESLTEGSKYFTRGGTLGDDEEFRQFILGVLSVL